MKNLLALIILFMTMNVSAQSWSGIKGMVITHKLDTISGVIEVQGFMNSAVVEHGGRIKTIHASQISHVVGRNECETFKQFYVHPYRSGFLDNGEPKLFQVLSGDGEIKLLRRVFAYDVFDSNEGYETEEYYLEHDGQIKMIRNFTRQVEPHFSEFEKEMDVFKSRIKIKRARTPLEMYILFCHFVRLKEVYSTT